MNEDRLAQIVDRMRHEHFDPNVSHTFTVVQDLRCLNCGAYYHSRITEPGSVPDHPKRVVHLSTCRGVWWDVDGEPRFYIDGRQVSEDEYANRCPLMPEFL